ncbi:isopenicillin N synthase family oxygenase [Pseudomonas sp. 5Ae-yellow]|uniref:isopenicillin N synthase family dioxygenase n=1 Tax=Pseudomonas sp. 5Ae-yellow TaxID=2759848 RepID=UPI0015F702B6|nr:isopenicillin N synthase family oxygenase [Pseudomonas sp. 5Ae-yellow]MBA6421112.1 isopenicillin N synthase family oxygenase [Pseudomonas sp. 5Ae-yellow]|tara:strand:- start:1151 stop:2080 length:930 start_codon:yes stop_codon:yes gene_type:complete
MAEQQNAIPVIDFSPFIDGNPAERKAVAAQMRRASSDWGFFYLAGCGMPEGNLREAFAASQALFALSDDAKQAVAWQSAESNRGYVGVRRERLDPSKPGDLKEAFNLAPEQPGGAPNLWPAELPAFRPQMEDFLQQCVATADGVLQAFALALQQPEDFFVSAHNQHHHTLRLLHYPALPDSFNAQAGESRAGEHTDYGSITLLFQDTAGGLEVRTRAGEWIAATPIPGTVVVNTGDLMQRWTNHVFCSTPHRVNLRSSHRERYSIAFFCHPNHSANIRCISTCSDAENPPRYAPISAGNHLLERLNATY